VNRFDVPGEGEQREFLFQLYFGVEGDPLERIIRRAYLDLSRTVHGMGKHLHREVIAEGREKYLLGALKALPTETATQESFDFWHRTTCEEIIAIHKERDFGEFYIGQSQKWVNMSLKYIALHPLLAIDYKAFYRFCHVPIDIKIDERLVAEGIPSLIERHGRWSRLKDYGVYFAYQQIIRDKFPDFAPLAVEFHLWRRSPPSSPGLPCPPAI
jgi:hypothetical protein